ncbi:MAG: transcriptional regulator [Bacteroidetes bacterium]|nr:MAG: transcriptional regulator [Bacteroidota bacterium]
MINQEEFVFRLKKVMEYYSETAASFSEKIGVQRSSISHILSGRNKPSLEFIMKILSSYDEIDLYWLLNGKGSFPKTTTAEFKSPATNSDNSIHETSNSSQIERIIIFYKDGSFKNFQN